ncbi:MAG: Magnesium and cobalt efflux protein CorC [Ignavibacteriae bacterium]|nr:MAG: Magnesium and cobalt efflux protein CorC [Ignavibacteriota bacterium]
MSFILPILILLFLTGMSSACESSILTVPKSILKDLIKEKNKAAILIEKLQSNPESVIAVSKVSFIVCLSLAAFLSGLFSLETLSPILQSSSIKLFQTYSDVISVVIFVPVLSFIAIIMGDLIPKSIAMKFPLQVARILVFPFYYFMIVTIPFTNLLTKITNIILKPFKDQTSFTESRVSEEEFKILLEEGRKTGTIDKTEQELITSIFEFTDTIAKEVMIPRTDVVAIDINTPREKLVNIVLEEGYSRIPVYSGSIDNIVGIIYTKDLIGLLEHREVIVLYDIIRPAYFVPETKKISVLLRELQQHKIHMAIVIDEFGGTEGIITLEDIIEEIVGEIHDEYDEELKEIESASDGTYLVNARINIKDFNQRFQVNIPENPDYETLSGFLHKISGKIPEMGEEIFYEEIKFVIVKKSLRRIRQVKVIFLPKQTQPISE